MLGLFIKFLFIQASLAIDPGPLVQPTKGEVWPKPQQKENSENYFVIRPHAFSFKIPEKINCQDILDDAITRYWNIIRKTTSLERRGRLPEVGTKLRKKFWHFDEKFTGYLDCLTIKLDEDCPNDIYPDFGDVENCMSNSPYSLPKMLARNRGANFICRLKYIDTYPFLTKFVDTLNIDADGSFLQAPKIWGILRGLETFSQLIYLEDDVVLINATTVTDYPRFLHRGLLLDTSRHFIPVYSILETLDAMSYNKLNVFHWHITDDQSFPYKSHTFPELSEKGAYHPVSKVYGPNDVKRIIEYARLRGIRVIPEFDTPGHTRSWGESHPEILTSCYENNKKTGELGPMDPTKPSTYNFLNQLLTEIVETFPDSYFHIGGDEVNFDCWKSNPEITAFMQKNNIGSYKQLESNFVQEVVRILDNLNSKHLVWEEVFLNGAVLSNSTLVHVWRDDGWSTLDLVTKTGKFAIFSSCWYLDHLATGGDWLKYYQCEIMDFPGTPIQKKLVLGGEACMWSESVNEYNLIPRVWPRASATAEKLWSSEDVKDVEDAKSRLEEHTCRMNFRGIQAEPPNGPGVCL